MEAENNNDKNDEKTQSFTNTKFKINIRFISRNFFRIKHHDDTFNSDQKRKSHAITEIGHEMGTCLV